jgi:hypothetical protein
VDERRRAREHEERRERDFEASDAQAEVSAFSWENEPNAIGSGVAAVTRAVPTWFPTVAAAVAGVALGWMLGQAREGETRSVVVDGREALDSGGPPIAPGDREAVWARLEGNGSAATEPAASAVTTSSDGSRDGGPSAVDAPLPLVEVHVHQTDGTPAEGAEVYAVPAGALAPEDSERVPSAQADETGVARLLLPADGLYDVGATFGAVHGMVVDVPSSAGRVDVKVPRVTTIDFVIDDGARRRLRPPTPGAKDQPLQIDQIQLVAVPADDRPSTSRPGRAQAYATGASASFAGGDVVPQAWMPEGLPCRVRAHARFPLRVEPEVVTPPARVRVVAAGCVLAVTIEPAAARRTFDYEATASIELRVDGRVLFRNAWQVPMGLPYALSGGDVRVSSPVEEGRLEWSGDGVTSGSTPFRAGPDGEASVRIVVEPTVPVPAPALVDNPPRRSRIRLVAPRGARVESVSSYSLHEGDFDQEETEWSSDAGEAELHVPEGAESVLAFGDVAPGDEEPELVAGPSRGTRDGASLTLVEGGFLVVVPERPTPPGLLLSLRRLDGLLFRWRTDDDVEIAAEAGVRTGMTIGPLQPGTARFALRLSGAPAGEVSALVVAGEFRPLLVPVRRAPSR